jgi:hypothetical protein
MSVQAAARWYSWISPPVGRGAHLAGVLLMGGDSWFGPVQRESAVRALAIVVGGVAP